MKSIVRLCSCGILLLMGAAQGLASDQIPWVSDFRTACGMAAEQHRLVLLHFYNDNCEWCVRLEQNVFSQTEVAEAVAQNYLAVKVHAGKNPQLAQRYGVRAFPTDVFVTPSGLEVYRTVSRQKPVDYIAVLHQVAQQTGVGAPRQWKSQLVQATQPAAAEADGAVNHAQQRWGQAVSQFQHASDQARAVAQQTTQQAGTAVQQTQQHVADNAQQATGAAGQWNQQAADAVQQYEQQAGDSYRHFREQAGQTGQQVERQAQAAMQEWRTAGQQTTQQLADAARDLRSQWQQAATGSPFDRRSAFVAADPSPASEPAVAAAPTSAASSPSNAPIASAPPPQADTPKAPLIQPPLVTNNPWVTARPSETTTPQSSPTAANVTPAPAASNQLLVPASEAPPIGLDGFCPVTLLETVARDPGDRSAWKKGDRQFGAIHHGRTYLFTSADQQNKFLASPDAYAPVLAGCDPVRYAERGEIVDGKRAYGLVTPDRRIFLFADEASRNRFEQSPAGYSAAIQQAMLRSDGGNVYR